MSARWEIIRGDVREVLPTIGAHSVDAILSDVPYGLGSHQPTGDEIREYVRGAELDTGGDFMGHDWNVPSVAVWRELCRIAKPGAHVAAFAGSRTGDLITIGMRVGGFEIRDVLMWMHAQGFPKSLDAAKAIDKAQGHWRGKAGEVESENAALGGPNYERSDKGAPITAAAAAAGYGSALKPSYEPITLARAPLDGTMVANLAKWGTGFINIDGCRVAYSSEDDRAAAAAAQRSIQDKDAGFTRGCTAEGGAASLEGYYEQQNLGRWPANVTLTHHADCVCVGTRTKPRKIMGNSDGPSVNAFANGGLTASRAEVAEVADVAEVWDCVDGCPVKLLDEQSGERPGMSSGGVHRASYAGGMFGAIDCAHVARGDSGGAARFFFTSKAARADRDHGLSHRRLLSGAERTGRAEGSAGITGRAGATGAARNAHPNVKPLDLVEWLAKLLLPPRRIDGAPRVLLVPYCGSGSEMIGALRAGWDRVIGIERDSSFAELARERLSHADVAHQTTLFDGGRT